MFMAAPAVVVLQGSPSTATPPSSRLHHQGYLPRPERPSRLRSLCCCGRLAVTLRRHWWLPFFRTASPDQVPSAPSPFPLPVTAPAAWKASSASVGVP